MRNRYRRAALVPAVTARPARIASFNSGLNRLRRCRAVASNVPGRTGERVRPARPSDAEGVGAQASQVWWPQGVEQEPQAARACSGPWRAPLCITCAQTGARNCQGLFQGTRRALGRRAAWESWRSRCLAHCMTPAAYRGAPAAVRRDRSR